jgi:hypothetical protein
LGGFETRPYEDFGISRSSPHATPGDGTSIHPENHTKVQVEYRPSTEVPAALVSHYQLRHAGTVRDPPAIESEKGDATI